MKKISLFPCFLRQFVSSDIEKFEIKGVVFETIYVEGGTFQMGDNEWEHTKPIHAVTVSDFWIGKYPVTQAQWEVIMGTNPSHFKGSTLPVEQVSWNDCQEFLKKLSEKTGKKFRLPSEEEWEYAARGGNKSQNFKYAGSDNIDEVAWYKDNSEGKTHTICAKVPNELGIYDMSGNVWEWTNSAWSENYNAPRETETYVLRGGTWNGNSSECRIAIRAFNYTIKLGYGKGFRLCTGL